MSDDAKSAALCPVGVLSVGASIPRGRLAVVDIASAWGLPGGRGSVAVCGPDEDTLTLACSAVERALDAADVAIDTVGGLWWGTARPPMPEGPSYAFLATAVGLDETADGMLASGSIHAGVDALWAAWDSVACGAVKTALVVASDALIPGLGTGAERSTGAGAVALVLCGLDGSYSPAGKLVSRSSFTRPFLDRYRGDNQPGTGDPYDARLYREKELVPLVSGAVDQIRDEIPANARWSIPDPDGRLGKVLARATGAKEVCSEGVFAKVGEAGSAAALLGALRGFQDAGTVCVVAAGGGRSSVVVVELSGPLPGASDAISEFDGGARGVRPLGYPSVLRSRQQLVAMSDPVPMGAPPGSAAFVRGNVEMLRLRGRRCGRCSAIAVPPSIHPVCPSCGALGGEEIALARSGTVQTFVINHTMPPPFEAPLPLAVVDLGDGARVMLQGMPEDASELSIGDEVGLELRRYALERGAPVYGFKVYRLPSDTSASSKDEE